MDFASVFRQRRSDKGRNKAYLIELASDVASYNIEIPRIRRVDNDSHLQKATHKSVDGSPLHL